MNQVPEDETFAVIRMDPVAMVRHLNDPEALRAAQALSTRSYLVYLHCHNPLPVWGSKPWHGFNIFPIGPSLRMADESECLTPDMCTPIFPNNSHPEGRVPVRTEPQFPFGNCFFWSVANMDIRVCPRAEGFDRDKATLLPTYPVDERMRWLKYQEEDRIRQRTAQQARQPEPLANSGSGSSPATQDDASSVCTKTSVSSCSIIASTDSVDTATEMARRFADPAESPELHPLCHLWCDVAANLKQGEIPSPAHLFEERDAIVRIIREARARDPTLPTLPVPHILGSTGSLSSMSSVISSQDSELEPEPGSTPDLTSDSTPDSKPDSKPDTKHRLCFRPCKGLRKVGLRIRSLLRIPYVVVWS